MNKCPKIGTRVKTKPTHRYGELTGTVMAIYPNYEWDEDREVEGPALPEREWQVGIKVDVSYLRIGRTRGTDRSHRRSAVGANVTTSDPREEPNELSRMQ